VVTLPDLEGAAQGWEPLAVIAEQLPT